MQPPFLVAGAAHWDILARAGSPLPPGSDVPGRIVRQPGGVALNIALGLAALGQPVTLLAATGSDAAGDELARLIAAGGVATDGLVRHAGASDAYVAIETASGTLHAAVADCTGLERAGPEILGALDDDRLPMPWAGTLVLDGNLPVSILERTVAHSGLVGASLVLVPASPAKAARIAPLLLRRPSALYVNRREAEALAGQPFADSRAAALALRILGAERAIVTDGAAPATFSGEGDTVTLAPSAAGGGVTGAGDCFVAHHLAAQAEGLASGAALRAALAAAAQHVARTADGTIRDGTEAR